MEMRSDSMSYQIAYNAIAEALGIGTNSSRDFVEMISCPGIFDTFEEGLSCYFYQYNSEN